MTCMRHTSVHVLLPLSDRLVTCKIKLDEFACVDSNLHTLTFGSLDFWAACMRPVRHCCRQSLLCVEFGGKANRLRTDNRQREHGAARESSGFLAAQSALSKVRTVKQTVQNEDKALAWRTYCLPLQESRPPRELMRTSVRFWTPHEQTEAAKLPATNRSQMLRKRGHQGPSRRLKQLKRMKVLSTGVHCTPSDLVIVH